jgi:hypothetical protein
MDVQKMIGENKSVMGFNLIWSVIGFKVYGLGFGV